MVESHSTPARKKVLAGVLMGLMVLSMSSTLHWLYEESSAICDQFAKEPLAMGATDLPCRATHISAVGTSERRFFYGGSGELIRIETRAFEEEEVEGVSCSVLGKLLLPFIHTELWMNHGVSSQMQNQIALGAQERGVVDEETRREERDGAGRLFERVEIVSRNAGGEVEWSEVRLYEETGVLVESVHQMGSDGYLITGSYRELDGQKNVLVRRVETVIYDEKSSVEVRYDYSCAW